MVFWVKDHDKRRLVAQPDLRDNETMIEAMERKKAKYNVGTIDPGKSRTDHGCDN